VLCLLCAVFSAAAGMAWQKYSEEHVFLSTSDWQKQVIAKIVWKKCSLSLIDCELVVENFYGKKLLRQLLVSGKDEPIDIFLEFKDISINGDTVRITPCHQFYNGPETFKISNIPDK